MDTFIWDRVVDILKNALIQKNQIDLENLFLELNYA